MRGEILPQFAARAILVLRNCVMHCESVQLVPRRLFTIVIVLTLVSSGCSVKMKHGCQKGKACYSNPYGVEDNICHGYQKTCWRSWNEAAWAGHDSSPSLAVRRSESSRDDPGMIHPAATPYDEPHATAVE